MAGDRELTLSSRVGMWDAVCVDEQCSAYVFADLNSIGCDVLVPQNTVQLILQKPPALENSCDVSHSVILSH